MDPNFVRADNSNLPKINAFMVAHFFKNNADYYAAELKNVKTAMFCHSHHSWLLELRDHSDIGLLLAQADAGVRNPGGLVAGFVSYDTLSVF
ncbi:hypothetical protein EVAR_48630_1 [Eumeta japonica]|uniref:Uncharacterized protein n=1 Tax=Eumeta variegata TaxID=151549 RepID=A0A4C1XQ25_EUMVA|nr:hypothetical protein EVAR_48630_1 [Eumeta japonica]